MNYDISTIISISTIESNGRLETPTAILACFPFSPKISCNKSDAAFITNGCFVNSGVEFTKPETLMIFEILSNVPSSDLSCANAFMTHNFAAFLASTDVSSFDTFPLVV